MSQVITHLERVRIECIQPNPFQPRLLFEDIESLAASIEADGLLHKIVLRQHPNDVNAFQIVDGERRLRALQKIGVEITESEVGLYSDLQMATLALKSDTEHKSFNVIEVANGYRNLIEHFGKTNSEIAAEYNVSGPVVSNRMRILALPDSVREMIVAGYLTETHAKTLCSIIEDTTAVDVLARQCAAEQWSSRRLEAEVAPVKESLEAAEKAASETNQPALFEDSKGETGGDARPQLRSVIFEIGDRIKWRSKVMPDADIFGTVEEVTAKYLVVAPDGIDADSPNRTIHLDFNVKKLPTVPKAAPAEAQTEAASQSPIHLAAHEKAILDVIAADRDANADNIAEEVNLERATVENTLKSLIVNALIERNDTGFTLTPRGENALEAAQSTERGRDANALSFEETRVLKSFGIYGRKTLQGIADDTTLAPGVVAQAVLDLVRGGLLRAQIAQTARFFTLTELGEATLKRLATAEPGSAETGSAPAPQDGAADAANEAPEKSDNDKQLESRAHETPAQKAGTDGVGSTAPASEGVGFPSASSEGQSIKPAPKLESASPDMTATIPGAEADWLDEHDLKVATVCALYRRFHQACEMAQTDPETMIATLERRAASFAQIPDTNEEAE